ncbi:MAG: SusD/RagB family nutrient-binding outer membrane lipoprotein [Bacteroidota bacterium]
MKFSTNRLTLAAATLVTLISGCAKKIDEAFLNPNAAIKQPIEQILPGVISNMAISASANGNLYGPMNDGRLVGSYVQFWAVNGTLNQSDRMGGATGASDNLGSIWAMHYYGQGLNINSIIEWGTEEKKWDYVGVAQAIRAWGWLTLTDMHDDVILKEAFRRDLLVFKYDTQEEVYQEVKRLCYEALSNLSKTGDGVNPANLAISDAWGNGGDINKWKKFVYGVLARVSHRITNKASYNPDDVIRFCDSSIQVNAENTNIKFSAAGGYGTFNFMGIRRLGGGSTDNTASQTHRQTKFIADLMSGVNGQFPTASVDPRAWYLIRENANNTFKGIRPTKGTDGLVANDQPLSFWGTPFAGSASGTTDANCRYIFTNAGPYPVMTASEIQFIKAEALLRKGDRVNALAAYRKGIALNFDLLRNVYETNVPVARRITDVTRDAYLDNPVVVPTAANLTLSHIMLQKYITMYAWGVIETWVDLRRFHYTDLDPVTGLQVYRDFAPPSGTDLFPDNFGKLVYRVRPRYNSEYLYNVAELNRLGAFALDYHTKECWFSKP